MADHVSKYVVFVDYARNWSESRYSYVILNAIKRVLLLEKFCRTLQDGFKINSEEYSRNKSCEKMITRSYYTTRCCEHIENGLKTRHYFHSNTYGASLWPRMLKNERQYFKLVFEPEKFSRNKLLYMSWLARLVICRNRTSPKSIKIVIFWLRRIKTLIQFDFLDIFKKSGVQIGFIPYNSHLS